MICGPHLTMDPGSLRRALKYGRYTDPSLKLGVHSMRRYFAAALARESVASAKSVEDGG